MVNRSRLYILVIIACFSGYIWLFFAGFTNHRVQNTSIEVCLIKRITDIPCPSCGSTRALMALLNGRLSESLLTNPMGILVAAIMLIAPAWILYDFATKGQTFYKVYNQLETVLKKPGTATPLILLVLMNWVWNIAKGL
jgi:hypothetical protein